MRDPGLLRVDRGSAEFFRGDNLVSHRLDHIGSGDVHIGGALHHEHKIRQGRTIDRSSGTGPHDGRDLGHDPRSLGVTPKNLRIAAHAGDALLNARAARVFEPDHWHSRLDSQIHHLADFLRVGFGETAPKHGEVLGKQIHWPTIDQGVTSHYAVPQDLLFPHSKVRATVGHIPIEFHK